jgi:uridylate kinase
MRNRVILKISGEQFATKDNPIDPVKVTRVGQDIDELLKIGDIELVIVVGGGNIWRGRNCETYNMTKVKADYMGMVATVMNALVLENELDHLGYDARAMTSFAVPSLAEPYIRKKALSVSHCQDSGVVHNSELLIELLTDPNNT